MVQGGRTALHHSAKGDNADILTILVERYHCDVHAKDNVGTFERLYVYTFYHSNGLSFPLFSQDGETPLHYAAFYGNEDAVSTLIEKYLVDDQAVDNVSGKFLETSPFLLTAIHIVQLEFAIVTSRKEKPQLQKLSAPLWRSKKCWIT